MQMFILDIGNLLAPLDGSTSSTNLDELSVRWQVPVAHFPNAPPYSILFSVNQGVDEIVLFAGMELGKQQVNNKLFFMRPNELNVTTSS